MEPALTINKTLLIIKSQKNGLVGVESYLNNRGWITQSVSDLKEGMLLNIQYRPSFVMISVDITQKKTNIILKAFQQSFSNCIILFGETGDDVHSKLITDADCEFKLYPTITGPAIERTFNKFLKVSGSTKTLKDYEERSHLSLTPPDDCPMIRIHAEKLQKRLNEQIIINNQNVITSNKHLQIINGDEQKSEKLILNLLAPAVENSLLKTTQNSDYNLGNKVKIQNTTNVACIIINSKNFSGYLIVAMGNNNKVDDAFCKLIRENLFTDLADYGEQITEQEKNLYLNIKQVSFETWALKYADFLKQSVYKADEVALAFFTDKNNQIKFEAPIDENMLSISIDEIVEDQKVAFNIYIYLHANSKYILYTPENSVFYSTQKQRLLNDGHNKIHLLKEDLFNFKKYRTENYLNSKIDSFELEQKLNFKK